MWPSYCNAHVLGLDRDATFALDIHRVEVLGSHQARVHRAGDLENAVREGRLAVIDVRNDADVRILRNRRSKKGRSRSCKATRRTAEP